MLISPSSSLRHPLPAVYRTLPATRDGIEAGENRRDAERKRSQRAQRNTKRPLRTHHQCASPSTLSVSSVPLPFSPASDASKSRYHQAASAAGRRWSHSSLSMASRKATMPAARSRHQRIPRRPFHPPVHDHVYPFLHRPAADRLSCCPPCRIVRNPPGVRPQIAGELPECPVGILLLHLGEDGERGRHVAAVQGILEPDTPWLPLAACPAPPRGWRGDGHRADANDPIRGSHRGRDRHRVAKSMPRHHRAGSAAGLVKPSTRSIAAVTSGPKAATPAAVAA